MKRYGLTSQNHVLYDGVVFWQNVSTQKQFDESYALSLSSKVGNSHASLVDKSIMFTSLNRVLNTKCSGETECS